MILTLSNVVAMSEVFDAKLMGVIAAIFLVVVTIWVLHSHYILSLFEAVLGVASLITVVAFIITRLIKSNYPDLPEENNA
jgi:hypothetical protein